MTNDEYIDLMLEGIYATDWLIEDYSNDAVVANIDATCALGAARYVAAKQANAEYIGYAPREYWEAENRMLRLYFKQYGTSIMEDSDQHGRDYVVSRLKAL